MRRVARSVSASGAATASTGCDSSRFGASGIFQWILPFLLISLSACAGVPSEELHFYSDAYDKARESGALIYRGFLPAALASQPADVTVDAGAGSSGSAGENSGPSPSVASDSYLAKALGPRVWVSSAGTCDEFATATDVIARCQALAAIAEYNQVLLRLDAGDSAQALQARMQSILSLVDGVATLAAFTPAAPFVAAGKPLLSSISGIVGEALTIRDRQVLRAKFNEGVPTVAKLIALLRKDVGTIYIAQWDHYAVLLAEQDRAVSAAATGALRTASQHRAPEGGELIAARADLAQRYEAALALVDPRPPDLAKIEDTFAQSDGQRFTLTSLAQISSNVKLVEGSTARYVELRQEWRAYVDALKAYDALLASVDESLSALAEHSNDPFAPGGGTAQLLESATAIRDHANEIERLIGSF